MIPNSLSFVELPKFIAKREGLPSIHCAVKEVYKETNKSFEVLIEPAFVESFHCWVCGKTITNPQSIFWGVGPDCAKFLTLPYEDKPEQHPELAAGFKKKIFLPLGLLSEEQKENFRTLIDPVESETGEKLPVAKVAFDSEHHEMVLSVGWINKKFVDELKRVEGWNWDSKKKITRFTFNEYSAHVLCEVLTRWSLLLDLDPEIEAGLKKYNKATDHVQRKLEEHGVGNIDSLKDIAIDPEDYEWGLKTTPWPHQMQAILWASTILGIEVPKKR